MSLPEIVTPAAWISAREALLEKEKALTRARDDLNAERRRLPMVEVGKDYRFDGPEGRKSLLDLFDGRRQLIVVHFMFAPDWESGCKACTATADEVSPGLIAHLHSRDTSLMHVSRAPIEKIERFRKEKGWTFPWYSSFGSDFNYDFQATVDPRRGLDTYNYRTIAEHEKAGTGYYFDGMNSTEQPGRSVFLRDGDTIYHTYSNYGRGGEMVGGSYYWLDLTPLGRQEDWEEPKDRVEKQRPASPDFPA